MNIVTELEASIVAKKMLLMAKRGRLPMTAQLDLAFNSGEVAALNLIESLVKRLKLEDDKERDRDLEKIAR